MGRIPEFGTFDNNDTQTLIWRYMTHKQFMDKASDISDAAKPSKITSSMKWSDWVPNFLNYLRIKPGKDAVPLSLRRVWHSRSYITSRFFEEYVMMAPIIQFEAYYIGAAEVHILILSLTMILLKSKLKPTSLSGIDKLIEYPWRTIMKGLESMLWTLLKQSRFLQTYFILARNSHKYTGKSLNNTLLAHSHHILK